MKVFLGDIVAAKSVIEKFAVTSFPAKTAYKIKVLFSQVKPHIEYYEQIRIELVKKYGKQDGNTVVVEPNSNEWVEFKKELVNLADTEIDLNIVEFSLEELCSDDNVRLTANDLAVFEVFCNKNESLDA